MDWKNLTDERPSDTYEVLISNGRSIVIGWYADDWNRWCRVGSRDIFKFIDPDEWIWWMPIPELPIVLL